jgi:hypothetical protein
VASTHIRISRYPFRALNGRHSLWFQAADRLHIGHRSGGTATVTP